MEVIICYSPQRIAVLVDNCSKSVVPPAPRPVMTPILSVLMTALLTASALGQSHSGRMASVLSWSSAKVLYDLIVVLKLSGVKFWLRFHEFVCCNVNKILPNPYIIIFWEVIFLLFYNVPQLFEKTKNPPNRICLNLKNVLITLLLIPSAIKDEYSAMTLS